MDNTWIGSPARPSMLSLIHILPADTYAYMTGTSMAAPMVTGAAALLYSGRPDLSLSDVKTALLSAVHKLAPLRCV